MSLEVYHGTNETDGLSILQHGFHIMQKPVMNDLGNGIYTFCSDDITPYNPHDNALRYAHQYKKGRVCVLGVTIDTGSHIRYIDLDDHEFLQKWVKVRDDLEYRAQAIWKQYHPGNAKKRHNLDGIILEMAIKKHELIGDAEPDFIVKRTYTSFIPRSISNFPNGRELVIRNLDIIKRIEKVK